MRDEMDRIFDDFFSRSPIEYEGYGSINLDMMQTEDDVVIKASIPGVKAEDINISVSGDTLTIRGEMKSEEEVEKADYHLHEIHQGAFARSVLLPCPVVADKAKADFENGILKLTLPKAEEIKPKTITVKAK
ncbi:HSP20 family protein [Pelolinea submarina]|nr:HSP20 family protein [Pelolinea submarina]